MEFSAWIARMSHFFDTFACGEGVNPDSFIKEIRPPLGQGDFADVNNRWGICVPHVLRDLWTQGSAAIDCGFVFAPRKIDLPAFNRLFPHECELVFGVMIMSPSDTGPGWCGEVWADRHADDPAATEHVRLWRECVPISDLNNGDYIAIDVSKGADDPPVAFLTHEEPASLIVCDRLSEFLILWEELNYIHPFLLSHFVDEASGLMSPSSLQLQLLRSLL
jgi:hypothetical protein